MSGNERKRQKREKEESRRSSHEVGSRSNQNTSKSPSLLPPKLPAAVWGKHIAPFLHRKELNYLLSQGGKEIYEACQNLKFPWPTVELRLPGVLEVDSRSAEVEVLRAISPDSKWIFAAPVTSKRENGRILHHCFGLYVFHSRCGRAEDVVPLPGRQSSSSPRDFQESTNRYYPKQMSISKDGRYLAVAYRDKVEIDLFRITFHEESKAPSVSFELHRTFDLDTSATSPFHLMGHSGNFVFSTKTKWIIAGYSPLLLQSYISDETAIVAWDIESGAIVKSEVGAGIHDPSHDILATDSMILWRSISHGLACSLRAWAIESGNLPRESSVEMIHPRADPSRSQLTRRGAASNILFGELLASPVDPYSFLAYCMEFQEISSKLLVDELKLDISTEASRTSVQKVRRIVFPAWLRSDLDMSWYPDGQHLLVRGPNSRFDLKQMADYCVDESSLPAGPRSLREDLVDKANMIILRYQPEHRLRNFELSPDGEFLVQQLQNDRGGAPCTVLVSQCCGNTPEEIRRRFHDH